MRLPELLAPAGSREAFKGAVSAGADAVYLGGMKFGARAYAANFSEEEIITSLREAHILGKKIYLTLNILTRESEMEETLAFAEHMCMTKWNTRNGDDLKYWQDSVPCNCPNQR